ncbi:uncharacterized protein LOC110814219 isoform X2 [Carica papaya]|nr:uncharacterized protein LOC110814219 isoform X2 [Carica papaya]XP_021897308.1 uncharacterized protein LOC110814219 isoform X2 [Carica papaya]XP_021897310.1 uncharacterized protein LOC110814219 isoform X2 [Carica papaya]XP_021897311.1 uncharacterized protein LOC110814219 isoform X2 [Carica papaya]XP_021897312.1 uncharacterized protein LOC110814219 isoform X2 [Carica papaya]
MEELTAKVVMVRFDSTILLEKELEWNSKSVSKALYTIKYLLEARAKIILVSDWSEKITSKLVEESIPDILSSLLQYKVVSVKGLSFGMSLKREVIDEAEILLLENLSEFKEEVANCSKFAKLLSSGVDIFVNDSFSRSHKVLASTVGVARFCGACVAGFYFEECLSQLKNAIKANKKLFAAIIGGGNIYDKAAALQFLASRCDGLILIGPISFQIMHALGQAVPSNLLERGAHEAALDIVKLAHDRNIPILCPKDFWCVNDLEKHLEIFPAQGILDGWMPVDLGPRSLEEINSFLTKCKKILWIGPVKFRFSSSYTSGMSRLAQMVRKQSKNDSDITVIGNAACSAIAEEVSYVPVVNMVEHGSVAWEFLKGRKLPAVMALDRSYPLEIDWNVAYYNPAQPLVVDIGSGNGLFIMGMSSKRKDLNFLGLEINGKLVQRCLDSVNQFGIKNRYFISTNATSTFRSIVSNYPGDLALVSIQCPNPDFNKPEHRWTMLQKPLIEAVADLLVYNGKVFLQSDIEAVVLRMKDQFLQYGKGKFALVHNQYDDKTNNPFWLEENPFGVRSDWEQHVLDRGCPMYRLVLSKSITI